MRTRPPDQRRLRRHRFLGRRLPALVIRTTFASAVIPACAVVMALAAVPDSACAQE